MARRAQGRYIHPSPPALGVAAFFLLLSAGPAFAADTTAPVLAVYAPLDGAQLFDDHVTVFGVTERGATVLVNGIGVQVNPFDGSFELSELALQLGAGALCTRPSTVTISSTDGAGNVATVVRSVSANACVTHPRAVLPVPDVRVPLGFGGPLSFDLSMYFADDGGADNLVFSTYAAEGAGVTVSSSAAGLSFVWAAGAAPGTFDLTVVARDRDGSSSEPVHANLIVGPANTNRAPVIALNAPVEPVAVGAPIMLDLAVSDPDGDEFQYSIVAPSPAFARVAGYPTATRDALSTPYNALTVRAVDEFGAIATVDVEIPVYDASTSAGVQVESPSNLEFTVSEITANSNSISAQFSTQRYVGSLAPGSTTPASHTPGLSMGSSEPLNAEHTLWSVTWSYVAAVPGTAPVRILIDDGAYPAPYADFVITILPDPVAPSITRIVPITGSLEVAAGEKVSLQWVGDVPDVEHTAFTWSVDGEPASHASIFSDISLSPGTHAVTVTAVGPGGSSSSSTTITVSPRAATLPATRSNAWMWGVGIVGLVVVGIILGGTEIGIYFLLAGIVGAIIDRGAREKLLTHFVRGRIYQIIDDEPGIHLSELQRKAGVARGVCAYHLHALEKAGLIKTAREGMYLKFFATKVKIDVEAYTLAADDKAVLEAIEAQPGITEQQVAAMLGKSNLHVTRAVRTLSQSGYVELRREGDETQLFARTSRGQPSTSAP